jgi:hypothetical protein
VIRPGKLAGDPFLLRFVVSPHAPALSDAMLHATSNEARQRMAFGCQLRKQRLTRPTRRLHKPCGARVYVDGFGHFRRHVDAEAPGQ